MSTLKQDMYVIINVFSKGQKKLAVVVNVVERLLTTTVSPCANINEKYHHI